MSESILVKISCRGSYNVYFVYVFQTQMLFIDAFIQNNRLDNVTQLMGYHPEYLDCFLKTQQYLLRGDGPLPYHFRHYIAIMVSIVSGALCKNQTAISCKLIKT